MSPAVQPTATPTASVATIKRNPSKRHGVCEERHDHARQLDERTDGEVDAGGDDHEGLADRDDRDVGDLPQHVGQVFARQERTAREKVDRDDDDRQADRDRCGSKRERPSPDSPP